MKRSPCHAGKDGPAWIAAFVGQIVLPHHQIGSTGLGPSRFVLPGGGGGVEHVAVEPHPKFSPGERRLTSSLQFGPFSVTWAWSVEGWNARPNMFRWPYVYTRSFHVGFPKNGLSVGALPSGFIRRTFPRRLVGSWEREGVAFSPTTA